MSGRWSDKLSKEHQCRRGGRYKAEAAAVGGEGFRSKLEGRAYQQLLLMERAGLIRNIRREQTIQLTPSVTHKLDFIIEDCASGEDYGVEAKGLRNDQDREWSIKRRLYDDFGPFRVEVWRDLGSGRVGCKNNETCGPGRYKWREME